MGKLFVFNMMSVDGYFAGPNGGLDWHNVDEEFQEFAIEQLQEIETILFGRVTYEMMAAFWSSEEAKRTDPIVAGYMNDLPKIVVSHDLETADWHNTSTITSDVKGQITALKKRTAKSIAILGSAKLTVSLLNMGLIDELRVMVNPVILGTGKALFAGIDTQAKLTLTSSRAFQSGNVLLCYSL